MGKVCFLFVRIIQTACCPVCQTYPDCLLSCLSELSRLPVVHGGESLYKVELFVKGAVFTHRGPFFLSDLGSGEFSDGTGFLCFLLACS